MEQNVTKLIHDLRSRMMDAILEWAGNVGTRVDLRSRMNLNGYYEFPAGGYRETGEASGRLIGWKPMFMDGRCIDVEFLGIVNCRMYSKTLGYLDTDTLASICKAASDGIYCSESGGWI